jgi:hypothetical protein
VIDAQEADDPDGVKARFLIEKSSHRIREIRILDEEGETTSITRLSEYHPIEGLQGKVQPMHILTEDLKEKTVTDMQITSVTHRPDLTKEDFLLEEVSE